MITIKPMILNIDSKRITGEITPEDVYLVKTLEASPEDLEALMRGEGRKLNGVVLKPYEVEEDGIKFEVNSEDRKTYTCLHLKR